MEHLLMQKELTSLKNMEQYENFYENKFGC